MGYMMYMYVYIYIYNIYMDSPIFFFWQFLVRQTFTYWEWSRLQRDRYWGAMEHWRNWVHLVRPPNLLLVVGWFTKTWTYIHYSYIPTEPWLTKLCNSTWLSFGGLVYHVYWFLRKLTGQLRSSVAPPSTQLNLADACGIFCIFSTRAHIVITRYQLPQVP